MDSVPWPFLIGIVVAIIANILWYRIKLINRSKGHKMQWLTHYGDLKHFKEIIRSESNTKTQKVI